MWMYSQSTASCDMEGLYGCHEGGTIASRFQIFVDNAYDSLEVNAGSMS